MYRAVAVIETHVARGLISRGVLVDTVSKFSWEIEESEGPSHRALERHTYGESVCP